uniref:Uncharacterized protein n=1 Tax=Trypanosoma vivax (strain Y486) TaxID=1055687 RepID=G0U308_TRYVY|nr:hypothetical protein, unlikely [Trypanosoma vivax Y486]
MLLINCTQISSPSYLFSFLNFVIFQPLFHLKFVTLPITACLCRTYIFLLTPHHYLFFFIHSKYCLCIYCCGLLFYPIMIIIIKRTQNICIRIWKLTRLTLPKVE